VNDNAPVFTNSVYHVYHLTENEDVSSFVIKVLANDKDVGQNAKINVSAAMVGQLMTNSVLRPINLEVIVNVSILIIYLHVNSSGHSLV